MRIAVLSSSYERSEAPFKAHDLDCDPSPWLAAHTVERHGLHKATATRQVRELVERRFDVFVNLCDGAWEEDRAGIEVVHALQRHGAAFTGASSRFYEPSREAMKRVCHYYGVGTPRHVFLGPGDDPAMALDGLRFPMIVKHSDSYSSIGMSRASRVTDAASLREQVARMVSSYGRALVEEFVEGREFTVLVADPPAGSTEPRSFLPVEFLFPPGETFKHFDLKWVDHAEGDFVPVADPGLDRALRDASIRFFSGISGDGYGRCDLRVDVRGEVHMLEINPNCGIFYPLDQPGSADAALQLDPSGHQGFVDHILDAALRRQARGRRVWRLRHDPPRGYGMVAALPLRAGDLIERHEERPHVLATRAHVERHWDEARRRWFRQYAWPLGDETFVLWDESPEDWRPVDHSCDPNAWLSGLDVVARRDIAAGEPISLDYATFCGPDMEPFDCHCGAVACRRSIRGTDCLRPGLLDRYGDHVSDAVRRLRRDAGGASRRT